MKVAVFGRFYNDTTTISVETLFNYLKKKGVDTYIETEFYNLIMENNPKTLDYLSDNQFDALDTYQSEVYYP